MNRVSKIEPATLASAMTLAFAEIEGATKDSQGQVGQQKYKYADLGAVIAAIKPALINHGLFFTQHPKPSEKGVTVETVLHHANGDHLSLGELFVPANKQDAQGFGSALTYARRYALVTAFGVPVEDDDGNAASRSLGSGRDNAEGSKVSPPGANSSAAPNDQQAAITKMIQLCEAVGGSQSQSICEHYGVSGFKELTKDQATAVIARLEKMLAEKAGSATDFGKELADEIRY